MAFANVDKLAKFNKGVKHLLVAADALSRYVRVETMKSNNINDTERAFARMIKKPKKTVNGQRNKIQRTLQTFCKKQAIEI